MELISVGKTRICRTLNASVGVVYAGVKWNAVVIHFVHEQYILYYILYILYYILYILDYILYMKNTYCTIFCT
jgi:hypothetical protein